MQKYKVFINDKWIFFGDFTPPEKNSKDVISLMDPTADVVANLAAMIKTGSFEDNIVLQHSKGIADVFAFFKKQFLCLEAAGGIVLQNHKRVLMIKRFGKWDFPKGKIETGETAREAAVREVEEETGASDLSILKSLPESYHIYRYGNQWVIKKNHWFLMQTDYRGPLKPQTEESIEQAVWVPRMEVSNFLRNSYASLQNMVAHSGLLG